MTKKIKIILLSSLMLLLSLVPASSLAAGNSGKQIVIIVDRLKLNDISPNTMPNLYKLQEQGTIGLMNTNTADKRTPDNTYLSIANGLLSKGGEKAGAFYNTKDQPLQNNPITAGRLYTSLTGWPSGNAAAVNPWVADIIKQNSNKEYTGRMGAIGDFLKASGYKLAVVGNSDTDIPRRYAASLVMDQNGRIDSGLIDDATNTTDSDFPFGIRTDYAKMLSETRKLTDKNDMVVVDLGDLSRLEEYQPGMINKKYDQSREKSLARIDGFIKNITPSLNLDKDQIMILVPTPSLIDIKNNNTVTPIIIAGGKFAGKGLITSNTTRRVGLVSNIDIAPTILDYFNITREQTKLQGRPATRLSSNDNIGYVKTFNKNLVANYTQRSPILYATAIIEIITIFVSLIIIRLAHRKKLFYWIQRLAYGFLLVPPVFLLFKYLRFPSVYLSALAILIVIILVTAIFEVSRGQTAWKFSIIPLFTSLVIMIDIATGYSLMVNSPLGYDLMIGARYYGIGNEYSGILLGSCLLGAAALIQYHADQGKHWLKKLPLILFLILVSFVIYAPFLGAEAGSFIAALAAFPYFIVVANGGKITPQRATLAVIGILVALFAGASVDHFVNGPAQSHIGQAMGELLQGNFQLIWSIIINKLSMNWHLVLFSIWSRFLLAVIAALAFFTFYPKGILSIIESKYPYIYKGIKATLVACIVAFLFNDSGLVEAATTSIYIIFPIIYLVAKVKADGLE